MLALKEERRRGVRERVHAAAASFACSNNSCSPALQGIALEGRKKEGSGGVQCACRSSKLCMQQLQTMHAFKEEERRRGVSELSMLQLQAVHAAMHPGRKKERVLRVREWIRELMLVKHSIVCQSSIISQALICMSMFNCLSNTYLREKTGNGGEDL